MKAFHNDEKIKEKYLNRVEAHAKADEIVKGTYWEEGKGCAVGCTIEGNDHEKYEIELGIPKELAYIEDIIFEELPNELAMEWPLRFLKAVPVGADLSKIVPQFVIWQFEDEKYGLKNTKEVIDDKEVFGFCEEVVGLYKRILGGKEVSQNEFLDLYNKIDGARAWAGAWAGAWARAWAGARAGAGAGAGAWARAWAGAEYESRFIVMADKLIELIENTK